MEPNKKEKSKRGRKSNAERAKMAQDQKKAATGGGGQTNPGPVDPAAASQGMGTGAVPMPPSAESMMLGKMVCKSISGLGAALAEDPRASMTPDELEAGAEVLARLSDKYLPQVMAQYGLEATALMIFGQYGLRIAALKKAKKIEAMEKQKAMQEHFARKQEAEQNRKPSDTYEELTPVVNSDPVVTNI